MDESLTQTALPGVDVPARSLIDQSHASERQLFELMLADLAFGPDYLAIMEEGWYWRDAAYIAWKAMPRELRQPKTEEEFCQAVGISRRAMADRRNRNAAIDIRAAKSSVRRVVENVDEIVGALIESATNSNYKHHPDRKLALEMAGVYQPKQGLVLERGGTDGDMSDLDEDELRRRASLKAGQPDGEADDAS